MENCLEYALERCQGFSALPRSRLMLREQRVLQQDRACPHLSHSAFYLVIRKNSSGAVDTDRYREQQGLPVGEELGIRVISTWGEVQMVECGAKTAFYRCLKDVASWQHCQES